jgi:putative colanic acid biosysnthesis UDP-glucose lipid carrier transferase
MRPKSSKMNVLKPFSTAISVLQRALDAALIAVGLYMASIALHHEWGNHLTLAAGAAAALFLLIGEAQHLYGSWRLRALDEEFRSVFIAWSATAAALIVGAFLAKMSADYSRLATIAWFLITPALLLYARLGVRSLLRLARSSGANVRTVAIVGIGSLAQEIVRHLEQSDDFGIRVLGVFDDRSEDRIRSEGGDPEHHSGTIEELIAGAKRGEIDYVFIALPLRAEKRIVELTHRLADTTASVYVIPDLFVFDLMRARWTMLGTMPAVSVYESPFDGLSGWLKRAEDLTFGAAFLLLAALPMIVIAAGVKLGTTGSVLFRQKRYGLNGRVVEVLKFRTMNASDNGAQVDQAKHGDNRVTPFGKVLRSLSLDELPQLFNVLRGDMSLVGPRPHAVAHNEEYRRLIHGYMLRHKVKPGITGWAQVNGWRGETDTLEKMEQRVKHDLEYLRNWSIWFDLKIMAKTILTVLSRRNAY